MLNSYTESTPTTFPCTLSNLSTIWIHDKKHVIHYHNTPTNIQQLLVDIAKYYMTKFKKDS